MKDPAQLLVDILLDKSAREDERDDAAMDLRLYKDRRVLEALMQVASDPKEDIVLIDNCAESIAEICVAINFFDKKVFKKLVPFAQKIVFGFIIAHKPELVARKLLEATDQADLLDDVVFDNSVIEDETGLDRFNNTKCFSSLIEIASNSNEDPIILAVSGELIAEVLATKESSDPEILEKLAPIAKNAAHDFMKRNRR